MPQTITINVARHKRSLLVPVGIAFVLGELWGHVGHGIDMEHIIRSAVSSAIVFGIIYLLQDRKPESAS